MIAPPLLYSLAYSRSFIIYDVIYHIKTVSEKLSYKPKREARNSQVGRGLAAVKEEGRRNRGKGQERWG